MLAPVPVSAKTPAKMKALRSYVKTYGKIVRSYQYGNNRYTASISYQTKKKRFVYKCTYTNGNSTSSVKMYMPVSKLKKVYTVSFNETVRAGKRTAKISGKAKLRRKSYNNLSSKLRFSRRNKTAISKKIKNNAYQNAANSLTQVAFSLWEYGLETGPAISFRNIGFPNIATY